MLNLVRAHDAENSDRFESNETRYSVIIGAKMTVESMQNPLSIRIVNISSGGFMAIIPAGLKVVGKVVIKIEQVGDLIGRIAWNRETKIGISLDETIDPIAFIATRAQRASIARLACHNAKTINKVVSLRKPQHTSLNYT